MRLAPLVIAGIAVVGAIVLFALENEAGAIAVLGVGSTLLAHERGYQTYNPELRDPEEEQ